MTDTADNAPVVEMTGITVEFPGVKALDDVRFRMYPGEVHSLMGENGAGKSTLIKALTGVYSINQGTIVVSGHKKHFAGTGDAEQSGIATVYQEVNLCTNLSIGENVMLGHEVRGPLGISWRRTHEAARRALATVGLDRFDTRLPLSSLPIAMQQLVAIARATVIDAKVLILDEPTSSLDENEVAKLFEIIRKLRDSGVAILFVSHFLDQVYEISDRLTVLRNGGYIGEYRTGEIAQPELISLMTGATATEFEKVAHAAEQVQEGEGASAIEVHDFGRSRVIEGVDLTIGQGEIFGFAGLLGSGRTELARLLFGADRPDAGSYTLEGSQVSIASPIKALKKGVAYSTENRRDEGIVGDLSVRENIILSLQAIRGWAHPIPMKEQKEICERYVKALGIKTASLETPIASLSGGNQQKVLLARWLATEPKVLILDEPTRGIDVGAKFEIQRTIVRLAGEGMTIVVISSEMDEIVRVANRILVLKDRRPIAVVNNTDDFTPGDIVRIIADGGVAA